MTFPLSCHSRPWLEVSLHLSWSSCGLLHAVKSWGCDVLPVPLLGCCSAPFPSPALDRGSWSFWPPLPEEVPQGRAHTIPSVVGWTNCLLFFHFPGVLKLLWIINHVSIWPEGEHRPIYQLRAGRWGCSSCVVQAHFLDLLACETLELIFCWSKESLSTCDFPAWTAVCFWFVAILRISWRLSTVMWQLKVKDEPVFFLS